MVPSERKINEIEEMFMKTSKPKTIIEDIDEIVSIGCIYDSTPQGENALNLAASLAKHLHLPLKVFTVDDFYEKMKSAADSIRAKETELLKFVDEFGKDNEVPIETESLIGRKIERVLKILEEEIVEEDKLSRLMIEKLESASFSVLVVGTPMLRIREEKGHFGFYLSKLLKTREIHSNFLLVPDELAESTEKIMGLVNFKQHQGTDVAIIRRAISLKQWKNDIHLVGIVEDNTIQTVARSEVPEETENLEFNLAEVRERIVTKFHDRFDSLALNEELSEGLAHEISNEIEVGALTSIVKIMLDKHSPALVLIRNVAKLDENLDPDAETLARIALNEGFPVLLLWD